MLSVLITLLSLKISLATVDPRTLYSEHLNSSVQYLDAKEVALNHDIISHCARRANGRMIRIKKTKKFLCRTYPFYRPNFYNKVDLNYRLSIQDGVPIIGLNIFLKYQEDSSDRVRVLDRFISQKSCVQDFYASQGIFLDLTMTGNNPGLATEANTVFVSTKKRPTHHQHWYLKSPESFGNQELNDAQLCGLMTHEIGHLLGLNDTYEDQDRCPDRMLITDPAIHMGLMNYQHSYIPLLAMATLEDFEIKNILSPLCPNI